MKKPEPPLWYVVYGDDGEIDQILNDAESCNPYAGGDYNGHCGGCDSCLLMQASHIGLKVERLKPEPGETTGDALGRVNVLWAEQERRKPEPEEWDQTPQRLPHETWSDMRTRLGG